MRFIFLAILLAASPALAQPHPQSKMKTHHVVIQIDQDDPAVINLALNNADNMTKYYAGKGEKVEIEFVAFGAGLAMMRTDKSPVKDRLLAMSQHGVVFSGCGNTKARACHQLAGFGRWAPPA